MNVDKKNMRLAIAEAWKAYNEGEVPIGAVLTDENGILICADHNRMKQLNDATAHAEMLVLRAASKKIASQILSNCTLYSTVEPCPMCAGALVLCRVKNLVYGATDSKFGAAESLFNIVDNKFLNHRLNVTAGILENECLEIIKNFFAERRQENFGRFR